MVCKLTAQGKRIYHLNLNFIQQKGEDKLEIIIIKIDIKVDIDPTVVIREFHTEVELSTDKITEEDCSVMKIIEMILGEEILKECKIIEVRIL